MNVQLERRICRVASSPDSTPMRSANAHVFRARYQDYGNEKIRRLSAPTSRAFEVRTRLPHRCIHHALASELLTLPLPLPLSKNVDAAFKSNGLTGQPNETGAIQYVELQQSKKLWGIQIT